jgi:hypothetical protein
MRALIAVWAMSVTAVLASMSSWHSFLFEAPAAEDVSSFLEVDAPLNMLHVMAAGCSCSGHLADYLTGRGANPDVAERVLILGDMPEQAAELRTAGFRVENIDFETARARGFLSAVPLLVIFDGDRKVEYIGGYASTPITPLTTFYDLRMAKSIQQGGPLDRFPVRGCAVSRELQEMLDPFGLKYRSTDT